MLFSVRASYASVVNDRNCSHRLACKNCLDSFELMANLRQLMVLVLNVLDMLLINSRGDSIQALEVPGKVSLIGKTSFLGNIRN